MSYVFDKIVDLDIDAAEERVTELLKERGFGVLTYIDVQATMKKKIDKDMPAYRILGACSPAHAFKAISAEPDIGTMLPCSVIVRTVEDGRTRVAAVDPAASMQAVENDALGEIACEVRAQLQDMIAAL